MWRVDPHSRPIHIYDLIQNSEKISKETSYRIFVTWFKLARQISSDTMSISPEDVPWTKSESRVNKIRDDEESFPTSM